MPKELEERLRAEAQRRFPDDPQRQNAYVYGALKRMGWRKAATSS
jgi:hypothetical protein